LSGIFEVREEAYVRSEVLKELSIISGSLQNKAIVRLKSWDFSKFAILRLPV